MNCSNMGQHLRSSYSNHVDELDLLVLLYEHMCTKSELPQSFS